MSTPYVDNSILSTKMCDHAVCAMTPGIVFLGCSAVYEILLRSGKVAQWVKVLTDDPSFISETHVVERENWLPQTFL